MRGTPAEGALARLLSGEVQHTVTCTRVAHTSTRRERFYDLALDVRGCADVYESLERLTQPELLDGDVVVPAPRYRVGPDGSPVLDLAGCPVAIRVSREA